MASTAPFDIVLLKEAADWTMIFQYEKTSDCDRQAFDYWHQLSPAHEAAWAVAQALFRSSAKGGEAAQYFCGT